MIKVKKGAGPAHFYARPACSEEESPYKPDTVLKYLLGNCWTNYFHFVARLNPTAMKPKPTTMFQA